LPSFPDTPVYPGYPEYLNLRFPVYVSYPAFFPADGAINNANIALFTQEGSGSGCGCG